ncbi:hypothetical protein JCM11641_004952 [Rhodosporidiobolus odoratus]
MTALRSSSKTARLASALHQLRAGPSSRPLPAIVDKLEVRYEGVKGNAAARHWAKQVLPGLRFANPTVEVASVPAPKVVVKESESGDAAEGGEAWNLPAGVTVTFNDPSLPQTTFFPLRSPQKSDKLVSKFWATFGQEATLRAFAAEGKEPVEDSVAVADAAAEQQEPAAAGVEEVSAGETTAAA